MSTTHTELPPTHELSVIMTKGHQVGFDLAWLCSLEKLSSRHAFSFNPPPEIRVEGHAAVHWWMAGVHEGIGAFLRGERQ